MHEVIVIGAGPAGSTTACELARRGIQVRLLERQQLGRRKLCAGGLPPKVIGSLGTDVRDLIEASCLRIDFSFASKWPFTLRFDRPVVHMVRREVLDRRLAETARAAGADLVEGVRVLGIVPGPKRVELETSQGLMRARAVVAADGATGPGARFLGRSGVRVWSALQVEVSLPQRLLDSRRERLGCDFGRPIGGIGWVFPKRDHLAVGVCADRPGVDLRSALDRLLAQEDLDGFPRSRPRGHPIPVWNGRRSFRRGAVLAVGDAAGLANPLTGAGIRRACLSGRLAAESLAAFLAGGGRDPEDLAAYDRRVRAELVGELVRARLFARLFYRMPQACYRFGVLNARVNPFVEQLLSGQKDYLDVFRELLAGRWLVR
jgi:geranylgeranyl reductase family protein